MTCIVGLIDEGRVYIGGDSAGVSNFNIRQRKDPKVFKIGKMVIGYTSSFRMGQLLRFSMKLPEFLSSDDVFEYMCTKFTDSVRECMKTGGYLRTDNGQEEGGFFLVGFKGRLFEVNSDFQISELVQRYAATGCGEYYALGSLYETEKSDMSPKDRLTSALECASLFSAGVCGPYIIESE